MSQSVFSLPGAGRIRREMPLRDCTGLPRIPQLTRTAPPAQILFHTTTALPVATIIMAHSSAKRKKKGFRGHVKSENPIQHRQIRWHRPESSSLGWQRQAQLADGLPIRHRQGRGCHVYAKKRRHALHQGKACLRERKHDTQDGRRRFFPPPAANQLNDSFFLLDNAPCSMYY
jgi:hypothetical protein